MNTGRDTNGYAVATVQAAASQRKLQSWWSLPNSHGKNPTVWHMCERNCSCCWCLDAATTMQTGRQIASSRSDAPPLVSALLTWVQASMQVSPTGVTTTQPALWSSDMRQVAHTGSQWELPTVRFPRMVVLDAMHKWVLCSTPPSCSSSGCQGVEHTTDGVHCVQHHDAWEAHRKRLTSYLADLGTAAEQQPSEWADRRECHLLDASHTAKMHHYS